jgi:uncharacterized protein YyaL (SSP411 family)
MNHLAQATSPYLLQHAHNPVDWYPWGSESLEKARAEDKPIFLSIGYAACHWCHVMAHESFEDSETAAFMNEHFVNIKVDREERPDLDNIYMQATVAMTGSGGWPMSVFLTPDLRPFFAGTYFPPVRRYNMPAFKDVLSGLADAWRNENQEINRVGRQVLEHLHPPIYKPENKNELSKEILEAAIKNLLDSYDWGYGGWGAAPKFPQPMTIEFLLRRTTTDTPQREQILKAVNHALSTMSRGGMYDILGGGFSRYSTDNFWRAPHFEKMLYDNAQLALAYLHGYLVTGEIAHRKICEETLEFVLRELTDSEGGFFSSLDADSEGEEGKFYVWTQAELEETIGADFDFFKVAYGITPSGNWEGKIILQRTPDNPTLASHFKLTPEELQQKLSKCHTKLLKARSLRIRPATDDKVLVMWNSLMIKAFAEAGRYLNRQDYLQAAIRNARFLLGKLYVNDRLHRSWREGRAKHNAYLEDYAGLILALLALYQSDPNKEWYISAVKLADEMVEHFADPNVGFFDTRDDHEALLIRPKDIQDNATPSGNALAATALLELSAFGDRMEWRDIAENMLSSVHGTMLRYPTAFAQWLCAADLAVGPMREVAIIGNPQSTETIELLNILWKTYRPRQIAAISTYPPELNTPALLKDRPLLNGLPTAYICQGLVCLQPVNSPIDLEKQLMNTSTP